MDQNVPPPNSAGTETSQTTAQSQPAAAPQPPATPEVPPNPFAQPPNAAGGGPFSHAGSLAKRPWLIAGVAAAFLAILGLVYYFYIGSRGTIVILEPKADFAVTLNDKPASIKNDPRGLVIETYPGVYRLKITKPDYQPFVQDIKVGRGQTITIRPIFGLLDDAQKESTGSVDYVRPSLDQKAVFYLGDNRKRLYRMEVATKTQIPLTTRALTNVKDVEWSTDTDVSLIVQSDGTYLQEIPKYDFRNQTVVKIGGTEVNSPIWDPTNPDRMAFVYTPNSGERSLVYADRRITKIDRTPADLAGIENPKLVWSADAKYILLIARSSDAGKNNLWIYSTADGVLGQLTEGGNVTDASFAPDSDIILYETRTADPSNPLGSTLSVMRPDGNNKKPLGISGNVAQAAWKDGQSFYLPDSEHNALNLYTTDGKRSSLPFTFPDSGAVQGMYYFPSNQTLIFYTSNAIYTASLAV